MQLDDTNMNVQILISFGGLFMNVMFHFLKYNELLKRREDKQKNTKDIKTNPFVKRKEIQLKTRKE